MLFIFYLEKQSYSMANRGGVATAGSSSYTSFLFKLNMPINKVIGKVQDFPLKYSWVHV